MISRALFELASRGYTFPQAGALNVNRDYRPPTYPKLRVLVLRDFYGLGRLLRAGERVELIEADARGASAAGRAELLV